MTLIDSTTGTTHDAASAALVPAGLRGAHSSDEFSPLKEIVVGSPLNARIPTSGDLSTWMNLFGDLSADAVRRIRTGDFPRQVVEDAAEDLELLVAALEGLGVKVHRPLVADHGVEFRTPEWRSDGFYSYCPRDLTLVVGSTIIETPSPMRARYFELDGLKPLFQQYMLGGSPWISAPKPQLLDDMYLLDGDGLPALGEQEPAFEAANVLRCGRDLFYQVSTSGNELGRLWLEGVLRLNGDYRVHALRGLYSHTHIDSTIAFIRPGLVLLNPERVTDDNLPAPLRGWDKIWCPPLRSEDQLATSHPLSSAWIGMNLLMVTPELAIVDADQSELIAILENRGVDVLPLRLRHSRVLGGGFHCVTLDTVRDGASMDYFS